MVLFRRSLSNLAGWLIAAAVSFGPGCVGHVGDVGGSGGSGNATGDDSIGTPARVRRLTRSEYGATVNLLIPGSTASPIDFPEDPIFNGYSNKGDALRVTSLLAQNLWTGAPVIADEAATKLAASPPCTASGATEEPCAKDVLSSFAARAYRRPLGDDEVQSLMGVYRVARAGADFKAGLAAALSVVFQSAALLYHTELGDEGAPPGIVQMTSSEIADQLGYLLTGGPPDEELLKSDLRSPAGREQHARRLLALPAARVALGEFAAQWTDIANVAKVFRDDTLYPDWSMLRAKTLQETKAFFGAAVQEDNALLSELFTASWTIADPDLATFYGATANGSGRIMLPAGQRSGLLTQSSVLAVHAQTVDGSPIRRGHFVRVRLLCQTVPPPPPKLVITPPDPDPTRTNRERFAAHSSNATCAGCHSQMDPIGFGLENFDAVGQYRDMDNAQAVDSSGTISGGTDIDGPFNGPVELGQRLSKSAMARDCFAQNWLEYALARTLNDELKRTITSAAADFVAGKSSVNDLVVTLARTDNFVTRIKTVE